MIFGLEVINAHQVYPKILNFWAQSPAKRLEVLQRFEGIFALRT